MFSFPSTEGMSKESQNYVLREHGSDKADPAGNGLASASGAGNTNLPADATKQTSEVKQPIFSLKDTGTTQKIPGFGYGELKSTFQPTHTELSVEMLVKVVSLQALLAQFSHLQVRADFINGCFGPGVNPDLLTLLDDFRWTVFPRWQQGGLAGSSDRSKSAVSHLLRLLNRSRDLLNLNTFTSDKSLSYDEWFSTLDSIASNSYWDRVPSEERCTHIIQNDVSTKELMKGKTHNVLGNQQSSKGPTNCSSPVKTRTPDRSSSSLVSDKKKVPVYRKKYRNRWCRISFCPPLMILRTANLMVSHRQLIATPRKSLVVPVIAVEGVSVIIERLLPHLYLN